MSLSLTLVEGKCPLFQMHISNGCVMSLQTTTAIHFTLTDVCELYFSVLELVVAHIYLWQQSDTLLFTEE